ncbi:UDP-2,3-diacylglucosamine diphosphatase [Granulosicoccaceae sp. 1_MG-2023]|nr:UDP-2,3-diacylglucosamine diphosphatase [Granulosicoccaceae sp. 1_MG-2023]
MSSLFISDLHLQPGQPAVTAHMLSLLDKLAPQYDSLWILGDFVEYWLGDDAYDGSLDPVLNALKSLHEIHGTRIRVMFGNRDFLLGDDFAAKTGSEVISDDKVLIEEAGRRILLMHGDTLCTEDSGYQQLRVILRNPTFIADFLRLSVPERVKKAVALREQSQAETADKSSEIMDVSPATVAATVKEAGADLLIHGHTHRPALHQAPDSGYTRIVLGDWHPEGAMIATLEDDGTAALRHWPEDFS